MLQTSADDLLQILVPFCKELILSGLSQSYSYITMYLASAIKAFYSAKINIKWIPCIIFLINDTMFLTNGYKE